jgi:biopolymer transport protein ExbD
MAKRRRRRTPGDEKVPVESFADIAFLLIVFFLLTTTFVKTMGFRTDIPSGEKSEAKQEKSSIIKLTPGQIVYNDDPVSIEDLRVKLAKLELAEKEGDEKIVMLEATKDIKYQAYYEVMAAISWAGGVVAVVEDVEGGK